MKKRTFKNLSLQKKTISTLDENLAKGGLQVVGSDNDIHHNTKLVGVCTCYHTCHLHTK